MTQNERLRALLAEARERIGYCPCGSDACAPAEDVVARIDAALAEPGEVHPSNLTDVVTPLWIDRDEARAEVEHWKAAAKQHAENHTAAVEEYFRMESERDEARAQRDEADSDAHLAEIQLREIVELVGEGGDGTAFGSVESMLMAHKHVQEILQQQRDEARAEIERLKSDSSWCELTRLDDEWRTESSAAYRRGAEAMRAAAMGFFADQQMYLNEKDMKNLPIPKDNP